MLAPTPASPESAGMSTTALNRLEAHLKSRYIESGRFPGTQLLIYRRGKIVHSTVQGFADLERKAPMKDDTIFRIYSMTKPITGMIAMMLIDEGKLGLDQPIAEILPAFARMTVQNTPDGSITDVRPAKTPITVRHLLTHTSGLGYSITQKGPLKAAYEAAGLVPAQVSHLQIPGLSVRKTLPSLAAFADTLATMPLVYEPGTVWSYSVSLDLLGRVIEVVAGKPFDTVVAERIFGPCGMTSSGFRVAPANKDRLTSNYALVGGHLAPLDPAATSIYLDPPAYPFGGAGLVSSPRDYDRFLAMLLNWGTIDGTRVMSERAVRLGTSDLLPFGADRSRIDFGANAPAAGFGAGGRVGIGADAGTYGWSGAAGTVGFISYRAGLRAGLFTQYMPNAALPVQHEFEQSVRADVIAQRRAA